MKTSSLVESLMSSPVDPSNGTSLTYKKRILKLLKNLKSYFQIYCINSQISRPVYKLTPKVLIENMLFFLLSGHIKSCGINLLKSVEMLNVMILNIVLHNHNHWLKK